MKYLAFVLLMFFAPCASFAQTSDQYRPCSDKAKTQTDMTDCAGEEAARNEAELDRVYAALLLKAEANREAVIKIKAAEDAWMVYRDSYIEALKDMLKQYSGQPN
jgi:uncharacterized protein YecT (DUF1311 family)